MSSFPAASTADWAPLARVRQGLYRFFGGALLPPETDRIEALAAAAVYLDAGLESFAFHRQWSAVLAAFDAPIDHASLNADYVWLFATGLDGALSPPVESHYRARAEGGGTAALIGALQRAYRALGVESVGGAETPDHVATEFEVLSVLCGREHAAWLAGDEAAARRVLVSVDRFLRRHPAVWVPEFRDRVRASGADGLYPAVVEAATAFILHDVDLVTALLEEMS